jgi:hypothetical protein
MKLGYLVNWILLATTISFVPDGHAQPVNLTCKSSFNNSEGKVTFDESAQTAGFALFGAVPVSSATFTDTEITWVFEGDKYSKRTYFSLNRNTGTLKESGNQDWHCTAAEKKF